MSAMQNSSPGRQCQSASKGGVAAEERSSFLKKRTKKLLFLEVRTVPSVSDRRQGQTGKSFLLLFFKKEVLTFP
jgi:hypothetical protein